jgi:hypothetical protein
LVSRKATIAMVATAIVLIGVAAVFVGSRPMGVPATTTGSVTSSFSTSQSARFLRGVTFSPARFDSNGTNDFLVKAQQAGEILEWAGDWQELGGAGAPAVMAQLAAQHNLKLMIVAQFFTQSTGELLRPLNGTNEQHYKEIAVSFAEQYRPVYLGLGIEVNVLYEKNATNFQRFVSLYSDVYSAMKSVSPDTNVFTIFQLEKMNGLNGGLYGGTNDPSNAEWRLLGLFPEGDMVAFTTYPGMIYHSPSEMPADYYARISAHTNKSVGFTEVGWHTGNISGGWGSDEQKQADFVTTFFSLSGGLNKAFVVWSFLYDQNTVVPFNTMGLFYTNGTAKLSWRSWLGG